MLRSEFAKKVVELMKEKGDVFYSAVKNMTATSGYFTALRVLGVKYIDAKKYAIMNLIADTLRIAYAFGMSQDAIEKHLKELEDLYVIRPDYEAIYKEILKYIEIVERPIK